jgi:hypothetical protein
LIKTKTDFAKHCEAMASLADLRGCNAAHWSLESDIKLQEYLAAFSRRLGQKTKDVVDKVENLSTDVGDADVRLRNTFNEFLMLGDTQFIENVSVILIF